MKVTEQLEWIDEQHEWRHADNTNLFWPSVSPETLSEQIGTLLAIIKADREVLREIMETSTDLKAIKPARKRLQE